MYRIANDLQQKYLKKTHCLQLFQRNGNESESCEDEEVEDGWEYVWDYVCMLMEGFDIEQYVQGVYSSVSYTDGPITVDTFLELEKSFHPPNTDPQAEFDFCLFEATNEALLDFARKDTPVSTQ